MGRRLRVYRKGMGVSLSNIDCVDGRFSTGVVTGANNNRPRSSMRFHTIRHTVADGSIVLLKSFVEYGDMERSASDAISSLLNSKNSEQYEDLSDLYVCLVRLQRNGLTGISSGPWCECYCYSKTRLQKVEKNYGSC